MGNETTDREISEAIYDYNYWQENDNHFLGHSTKKINRKTGH